MYVCVCDITTQPSAMLRLETDRAEMSQKFNSNLTHLPLNKLSEGLRSLRIQFTLNIIFMYVCVLQIEIYTYTGLLIDYYVPLTLVINSLQTHLLPIYSYAYI